MKSLQKSEATDGRLLFAASSILLVPNFFVFFQRGWCVCSGQNGLIASALSSVNVSETILKFELRLIWLKIPEPSTMIRNGQECHAYGG